MSKARVYNGKDNTREVINSTMDVTSLRHAVRLGPSMWCGGGATILGLSRKSVSRFFSFRDVDSSYDDRKFPLASHSPFLSIPVFMIVPTPWVCAPSSGFRRFVLVPFSLGFPSLSFGYRFL